MQKFELEELAGIPLLLNVCQQEKLKAEQWAERYAEDIEKLIQQNGAVVIRGLKVYGSKQFGSILSKLFGLDLAEYTYRSTPRTGMRGGVYTATEYPASEVIALHNENAYARKWPSRIGFVCLQPPETGGETPIGDSSVIYDRLPAHIRDKFEEKGIKYVRNYTDLDLPWSEVFQTESKQEVEQFCRDNDLTFQWLDNNCLKTSQVNPAVITHPTSGKKIWFNQAHLFHVSNLDPELQQTLLNSMNEESLPRNAYYGDGSPIEADVLDLIREEYQKTKLKFTWQKNDIMLLDNLRFTHGRESYSGVRKVLTGMA